MAQNAGAPHGFRAVTPSGWLIIISGACIVYLYVARAQQQTEIEHMQADIKSLRTMIQDDHALQVKRDAEALEQTKQILNVLQAQVRTTRKIDDDISKKLNTLKGK